MKAYFVVALLLATLFVIPGAVAKNDDPCRGFWYYEDDVGPTRVYTNANPDCTGAFVFLPTARQCFTEGEPEHVRSIGNLHVYQETCA